jgi:beta-mannosidase
MINRINELSEGWRLYKTLPNEIETAAQLELAESDYESVSVPSTVSMVVCQGTDPWHCQQDITEFDWWYLLDFNIEDCGQNTSHWLEFHGLATLTEVWLNDRQLLVGDNAFRLYQLDVTEDIRPNNRLALCFRSQQFYLNQKHPRPRWKTSLVSHQNLRWLRTTVLGYVSSWTPPIKLIGPWRSIYHKMTRSILIKDWAISGRLDQKQGGLSVTASFVNHSDHEVQLVLDIADQQFSLTTQSNTLAAELQIDNVVGWMPHTHGTPKLYPYKLYWVDSDNDLNLIKQGNVGFKSVNFDAETSQFSVNGVSVFCRGTCWSVSDFHSLSSDYSRLQQHLLLLRDAGVNMIRVGGTMIYESDAFYEICSELGIMVWQDFMFASMDYPFNDDVFYSTVIEEVLQQIKRIGSYAALCVWCGNTDVEAQVAMFGLPREFAHHSFYTDVLKTFCTTMHPQIPYFTSSPTGGALPFHLSSGIAHYWGTGAYMHDLPDPDAERVKFCSEGMGLSHIPEEEFIERAIGRSVRFPLNTEWRSRTPRDLGAGWDFEDIRDHYLKQWFSENPISLKRQNIERYIQLSTLVTGLVIADVFRHWRRPQSKTNGGLIWFNRDFWPCAGFGLFDSEGNPKAAYYLIRQSWKNRTVLFEPLGLDGLAIHIINELPDSFEAVIRLKTFTGTDTVQHHIEHSVRVGPNSSMTYSVEELIGSFIDPSYAYRFGPPHYWAISAELMCDNVVIDTAIHYVTQPILPSVDEGSLTSRTEWLDDGQIRLHLTSTAIIQYAKLTAKNCTVDENYFTLLPGVTRVLTITPKDKVITRIKIHLSALNLTQEIRIPVDGGANH